MPQTGSYRLWPTKRCISNAEKETFPQYIKWGIHVMRKEVARLLKVSLVTLTDWMKRGLPFHKQRGRVYFVKSEVLDYIRENSSGKRRLSTGLVNGK